MAKIPSLPDNPHLGHVFARFPKGVLTLCKLHDEILRGESELSIGERELIAAVTSATNACNFCYDAHRRAAAVFDVDVDLVDALVTDFDNAPVDPKLRPMLAYAIKLTRAPAQVTEADSAAVLGAGWSEEALMDAIWVIGIFNLMNRMVEGSGVVRQPAMELTDKIRALYRTRSYQDFGEAALAGKLG